MFFSLASYVLIVATAITAFHRRMAGRFGMLAGALIGASTTICVMLPITTFEPLYRRLSLSPGEFAEKLGWISAVGTVIFFTGLFLAGRERRNQERRIAELEAILRDREDHKVST